MTENQAVLKENPGENEVDDQWSAYDFTHPEHRLGEQIPQLDIGGRDLVVAINTIIDNVLHIPCVVSLTAVSLYKYHEFVEDIEEHSCIFDCTLNTVSTSVLLCFDQNLILKFVEKYFGGTSPSADSPKRVYSTTEKRLATRLYACTISAINEVWGSLFSASQTGNGLLSRSEVLAAEAESSVVAVLRCQITVDESEMHFSLALPWQALVLIRQSSALNKPEKTLPDTNWQRSLGEKISTCEVDVHGLLAETRVTVENLLKMQAGDFIPLGEQQTATFTIDNIPVFNALIGTSKSQVSASFLSWIEQGESSI